MLAATISLLGAVVYGSADFFGGLAARRLRSIVVTALSACAGLVALAVALPVMGGVWSTRDVLWGVLAGVVGIIAIALLYASLAIGPMSILSPLTAVVSAIGPMVWGLTVNGESLSVIGYAGLAVALVAVVLVGFLPGEKVVRPSARGILMGIGSGLAIGAFLIVMDHTSSDSGIVPLFMSRTTSTVITAIIVATLMIVAVRRGRRASSVLDVVGAPIGATPSGRADLEHVEAPTLPVVLTRARAVWFAAACGVLDAAANAMMLIALRLGDLSIVSALTALYPAGTIILAAVVLGERVARVQWLGLALAIVAGGMLGLA